MSYYVSSQLRKAIETLSKEVREALNQQTQAINESTKATRENKQNPLPVPLRVQAETKTEKTEKTEQREESRQNKTIQILLTIGTYLAFLAAAYYAHIASGQLDEMSKATQASIKALTETQAAIENAQDQFDRTMRQIIPQTVAQLESAKSAQNSVEFAHFSFRQEQRPYLWASPAGAFKDPNSTAMLMFSQTADKSGMEIGVNVPIQNGGKSPASDVVTSKTIYIVEPSAKALEDVKKYVPIYTPFGGFIAVNLGIVPGTDTKIISNEEYSHLVDGTWTFYVVGGVQYRDSFLPRQKTRPYETLYCWKIHMVGMPFGNCETTAPDFHESIK